MLCQELVDDLGEQLVCYQRRVCVVGDNDAANALGAPVGVERVVCYLLECAGYLKRVPCLALPHLVVVLGVFAQPPFG